MKKIEKQITTNIDGKGKLYKEVLQVLFQKFSIEIDVGNGISLNLYFKIIEANSITIYEINSALILNFYGNMNIF
jgi:hypothetical protein